MCRQSTPETFCLTIEAGQTQDKPDEGLVAAAKTGNFGVVRLSFKCSYHKIKKLILIWIQKICILIDQKRKDVRFYNYSLDFENKTECYIEHFIRDLNKCRNNPAGFAQIIEDHMQYIEQSQDSNDPNPYYYVRLNMPKVALNRGPEAFKETADRLRNTTRMGKVELKHDLEIPISECHDQWGNKDYIQDQLHHFKDLNKKTRNYKHFNFFFDLGSPYAEASLVLQLVDDSPFKGSRSRTLLNPSFNYVGISSQRLKNKHCGYYLFANK